MICFFRKRNKISPLKITETCSLCHFYGSCNKCTLSYKKI